MRAIFDELALPLQIASCFIMTGVILVIQLIHYPGFAQIDKILFTNFHARHSKALGLIAGPMMCAELITALWLARSGAPGFVLNAAAVLILWFLTFFISVPAHNHLAFGFDEKIWRRLLTTNWPRTILWCLRTAFFFIFLTTLIKAAS